MPKYIFVTGGVVSSLGKGLAASSIAAKSIFPISIIASMTRPALAVSGWDFRVSRDLRLAKKGIVS